MRYVYLGNNGRRANVREEEEEEEQEEEEESFEMILPTQSFAGQNLINSFVPIVVVPVAKRFFPCRVSEYVCVCVCVCQRVCVSANQ